MKIDVLVGMTGSGKSTYARERAMNGAMIVSHDDLVTMLHGRYEYSSHLRRQYQDMEEALARVATLWRNDLVIDRTHLTWASRKRWIDFAAAHRSSTGIHMPIDVVAVVFPIESPEVHALRRFSADPRGRTHEEWLGAARRHYGQAIENPVDEREGFTGIEWREFADGEIRESTRDRVLGGVDESRRAIDKRAAELLVMSSRRWNEEWAESSKAAARNAREPG